MTEKFFLKTDTQNVKLSVMRSRSLLVIMHCYDFTDYRKMDVDRVDSCH